MNAITHKMVHAITSNVLVMFPVSFLSIFSFMMGIFYLVSSFWMPMDMYDCVFVSILCANVQAFILCGYYLVLKN